MKNTKDNTQLVEDLLKLNSKVEVFQKIIIGKRKYTITDVTLFEDEYNFDDDYKGELRAFLQDTIQKGDLDFLDGAGICIMKNPDNEYEEDMFIPFITLATKHKDNVTIKEEQTVLSL